MEHHLPYEITQCYLPPNTGECTCLRRVSHFSPRISLLRLSSFH